ncbi:RNA polymerase sigma factor [Nostoc sphaeroides CHAB 2801]|uniref:RNA polymerase sigma factor n=1 Tax=Nostoc sphaeroides TaxID=446679 RepID=UPI000E47C5BE|nr:RNA polymerase sigma factor [Nostoc sphaeroides]MCC5627374.1 RNA polymerase sigma factor [Nostoc sphaeroides CHAB 2801]
MQAHLGQKAFISLAGLETENHLWSKQMRSQGLSGSDRDFWQLWAQYQDYFYSRSLRWMSGNPIDAEDALSQAMLKAWNEWPKYAGKITNPKAWLSRITHNLCIDIHRKRQRERMENIEDIQCVAHEAATCSLESAESEIFRHELRAYLNHRIESLPPRLRDPFILHYCQEKSYRDIAKELSLSEDNIRKRVKQAQTILQKHLNKYLAGEDDTFLNSLSPSLKSVIPMVEESQPHETMTSDWEAAITTHSIIEEINYKVSVIWLETLPHTWYSSPSLLGWT